MSPTLMQSVRQGPRTELDSRTTWPIESVGTWENSETSESTVFADPHVKIEDVEGLPISLVERYADVALRHAVIREVDPGVMLATVAGLEGAWGDGDTPEEAMKELREGIIGWVAVKRRVGVDIPPMEGIDLNLPR